MWVDHGGNKFKTKQSMCDFHNVTVAAFGQRWRKYNGDMEKALTPAKVWVGFGKKFDTFKEMCDYYGVETTGVRRRIANGESIDEALTVKYSAAENRRRQKLIGSWKFKHRRVV